MIGLFQIKYQQSHAELDPKNFLPFDVADINIPSMRELTAFEHFSHEKCWQQHKISGLFSPRFEEKTNIPYLKLRDFIQQNQTYDVLLVHPYPREISIANHFLELAEWEHPGITRSLELVWRSLFDCDLPTLCTETDLDLICHCNYFAGNALFWEDYSQFIIEFKKYAYTDGAKHLHEVSKYTLANNNDKFLPLIVFTFERAFSLFLKQQMGKYKIANFRNWDPTHRFPELFLGEADFVSGIHKTLEQLPIAKRHQAKQVLIETYYKYRKIAVG